MNILRDQCKFFSVPQELVRSGLLKILTASAIKLYVLLLELAQKHNAVRIELTNFEIEDYAIHANSVKKARLELAAAGLIKCEKRLHGIFEYQLLNPLTKFPLEPPNGRKGIRRYRPRYGRSARTVKQSRKIMRELEQKLMSAAAEVYPHSWDEIAADPRGEPGELG